MRGIKRNGPIIFCVRFPISILFPKMVCNKFVMFSPYFLIFKFWHSHGLVNILNKIKLGTNILERKLG